MSLARVPAPDELRAMLARGRGSNVAATFRFVDDVSILLEPAAGGTAVSARSASRVGRRDFGQNRRNLAELWQALGLAE